MESKINKDTNYTMKIKYNTILIKDEIEAVVKEDKLDVILEQVVPKEYLPETATPEVATLIIEPWGFIDFTKYLLNIIIAGVVYDSAKQFLYKLKDRINTKIRENDQISIVSREGNYEQLLSTIVFEFPASLNASQLDYVMRSIPIIGNNFLELEKYCKFTVSVFKFSYNVDIGLWRFSYKLSEPYSNYIFLPSRLHMGYKEQIKESTNLTNINQLVEKLSMTNNKLKSTKLTNTSTVSLKQEIRALLLEIIELFFNTPEDKENILKLIKDIK